MLRTSYPQNTILIEPSKNTTLEFKKRLKEANAGSASAQFAIALHYEKGEGVARNVQLAFEWCKKAAFQDWTAAIYHLAYLYQEGIGTPQNPAQSLEYYGRAAVLHFAPAICELGWREAHGERCTQSHPKAIIRYKMAATQNSALALYNLGWMHEQYDFFGLPPEKSDEHSIIHYYTQAHHHEPRQQEGMLACFALILFTVKHPDGFLKNPWVDSLKKHPCRHQLFKYYQAWADTIALPETSLKIKASLNCRLGIAHLMGVGLPQQNITEAGSYFQEAHNFGYAQASIFLQIVESMPMMAQTIAIPIESPLGQRNTIQPLVFSFSTASEGTPLMPRNSLNLQNGHAKKRPRRLCPRACTIL